MDQRNARYGIGDRVEILKSFPEVRRGSVGKVKLVIRQVDGFRYWLEVGDLVVRAQEADLGLVQESLPLTLMEQQHG